MSPTVYVNGLPVDATLYQHRHARPETLFLALLTDSPLRPGDKIQWSGDLPEGKSKLWVRFQAQAATQDHPVYGHSPLEDRDRLRPPRGVLSP